MDLIQSNGQPHYGRFTQIPNHIDYQKIEYRTPYGHIRSGWRKRLKYKKFKFCSIQHEQYSIGVAIADLAWAGYGFFYIYDHHTQRVKHWQASNFLAYRTCLDEQPLYNQSFFHKSPYNLDIQHAQGVRYIRISRYGDIKLSARIFCAGTDPMSICAPHQDHGWTYTQKLSTLGCEGFFVDLNGDIVHFHDRTFASLDDTCGFLPTQTTCFWLSCNFWQNEQRIGLNLSSGMIEGSSNENCLWVNGQLYTQAHVEFKQINEHVWHISSACGAIQLQVTTTWCRQEELNLRLIGNQFRQWQATISGQIRHQQQHLEFKEQYGLLEAHSSKW